MPIASGLTEPERVNDPVLPYVPVRVFHEPSRSSVQEAPGSVKTVQAVSVNGELPESETIGGVVSLTGVMTPPQPPQPPHPLTMTGTTPECVSVCVFHVPPFIPREKL